MRVATDNPQLGRVMEGLLDDLESIRQQRASLALQDGVLKGEEANLRQLILGVLQDQDELKVVGERLTVSRVSTRREQVTDEKAMREALVEAGLMGRCLVFNLPEARKVAVANRLPGVGVEYDDTLRVSVREVSS